jgi:hypothetical protein
MRFDAETPPPRRLLPLQVEAPEILQWLLGKDPQAIGSYRDMGREEYARAFTAAQTAGYDVIDDIWAAIIDTVERGQGEEDFSRIVMPTLKAKGWLGGDDGAIASRLSLIFDTNLNLARRQGRWQAYWEGRFAAPYLRGVTVGDERVRHPPKSKHSDHRAWEGIILPIEHSFWQEYGIGGWDFRCRCTAIQMTRSQLARRGGAITSEAELAERRERLGPPVFAGPTAPIEQQLAAMVAASNSEPRLPGRPDVDIRRTEAAGGDAFDAVLRASSLQDIGRQLARIGL